MTADFVYDWPKTRCQAESQVADFIVNETTHTIACGGCGTGSTWHDADEYHAARWAYESGWRIACLLSNHKECPLCPDCSGLRLMRQYA